MTSQSDALDVQGGPRAGAIDEPAVGATPPAPVTTLADAERVMVASQRQLMWWRFRKHKLALIASGLVIVFYGVAIFADFLAYADPYASAADHANLAPQEIHWFDESGLRPYVYGQKKAIDLATFQTTYTVDPSQKYPLTLFAHGYTYRFLGLIETDLHLIGVSGATTEEALFLAGTDNLGRDVFSRMVLATRTSLFIGLVGVFLSLFLGVVLGGISGFYGGVVDSGIQRVIEIISSVPAIPLWMALAAAMPRTWDILLVYFAMTIILAFRGWTGLARQVRGRFLSLRGEDFISAAQLAGAGPRRIITAHLLPLATSHIIAVATLALPAMILAETALSYLGLGLRAPAISWGVLLNSAQNIQTIANTPWLMLPVIPVMVVILAFNFLGDGLRDAADPYGV